MADWDLEKVLQMAEKLFGPFWGRLLCQISAISGVLFVVSFGLYWFLGEFIGKVLWPGTKSLFEDNAISVGGIEFVIAALVATVAFFVLIFSAFVFLFAKTFKRRSLPQSVLDDLSELRSDGIGIFNKHATTTAAYTAWNAEWQDWRGKVTKLLTAHFTRTEVLMFSRLGIYDVRPSPLIAVHAQHMKDMENFIRELDIVWGLISHHQARH